MSAAGTVIGVGGRKRWSPYPRGSITKAKCTTLRTTRPFPSSPGPLFQNEGRCSAFDMEITFHSHTNKTHFHMKGCAPSLILEVRVFGTRKWPIAPIFTSGRHPCDFTWVPLSQRFGHPHSHIPSVLGIPGGGCPKRWSLRLCLNYFRLGKSRNC